MYPVEFTTIFTYIGIAVYLLVFFVSIACDTTENVEYHDGGFLNLGFTTCDYRRATTKDVWKAIFWPIRAVWFTLKGIILLTNLVLGLVLLIVGIKYNRSEIHDKIEDWCHR